MRTGPFSNAEVIDRLNSLFVPVYAVNEDYRAKDIVPKEEQAEYLRIYRETLDKKFSAGTVHVYILSPSGEVIGSRHVAEAAKTKELIAFLNEMTSKVGTKPGKPLVEPKAQSVAPPHAGDALVLHLASRGLGGGGSWDGTAENWIVYSADETRRLLPQPRPDVGTTWELNGQLTSRLLVHVYPVTENNNPAKNEILQQKLTARVIQIKDGVAVARLDGSWSCAMISITRQNGNTVETALIGYAVFERNTGTVKAFRLVTQGATYGGGKFGVAIRSE